MATDKVSVIMCIGSLDMGVIKVCLCMTPSTIKSLALSIFITRDVITHCYSSRNKSVPYV